MSGPFQTQSEAGGAVAALSMADRPFGVRHRGRYKMPLLPGESGIKSLPAGAVPWVPRGLPSTTELVSAFAESRGLSIWEQEQMLYGLYRAPSLAEEMHMLFQQWEREGVNFAEIGQYPHVRAALTGGSNREATESSIAGRAKQAAGANEAREKGNTRHVAWEHYTKTGELIGTPEMQRQIGAVAELLERHRLQLIPELSERVIRNCAVKAAGRFDNILLDLQTGRLLMADLKTKRKAHWTWMEVDAQLAVYARAEWMLSADDPMAYDHGPMQHVDQKVGVVLCMPSTATEENPDAKPYLRRADLEYGWRVAQKAREIVDMRAYGKSAARMAEQHWPLPLEDTWKIPTA